MKLYLKWLDRYERREGEESPIGLILCTETSREQIELLEMHKDGIVVAEYWTALPPKAELAGTHPADLSGGRREGREARDRSDIGTGGRRMSSLSAVLPHLEQRFESQRLVFWHDADGEYAAELDALDLGEVTTLRVENNEYAVKNRVLHDEPSGKFLIYRAGGVPSGIGNWLLDLELAYGVFTADRTGARAPGPRSQWHRNRRGGARAREVLPGRQASADPQGTTRGRRRRRQVASEDVRCPAWPA